MFIQTAFSRCMTEERKKKRKTREDIQQDSLETALQQFSVRFCTVS